MVCEIFNFKKCLSSEAEELPEDIEKGMEKEIQELVQMYNKKIEEMLKEKEQELMTI